MGLETTQPSLLSRVRDSSNHAAWREFDHKYRGLILRYCRRRGLQPTDAEDVRQMVMMNMAKHLRGFTYRPEEGRFRNYLGRTVQNAIHRWFRRPRPEVGGLETHVLAAAESGEPEPETDVWEQEWMHHHYRLAMATVRRTADAKSVEVFEHLLAGSSVDEVAQHFHRTRDAVHKVKQRMRDRLKVCIQEQIREEEFLDRAQSD